MAKCFASAGQYGRYVISSGPYMLQGSGSLNIKSCSTMKPISGSDPSSQFTLVRNPNYSASTDNPQVRPDLPERIHMDAGSECAGHLRPDQGRLG